jgi:tetratricopeptide (TPR) repeat protein
MLFEAQQALSKARLREESGQAVDREALRTQFNAALDAFAELRPELTAKDSTVLLMSVQARLRLADLHTADSQWNSAAEQYRIIVSDTIYGLNFRHVARMQLGRSLERLGQFREAAAQYRALLLSFYPPRAESGINAEVLGLPRRLVAIASEYLPDSLAAWRAYGEGYYDTLATRFPHTDIGLASLGELGKLYAGFGEWSRTIASLERATDTSGAIMPAYWIDIGEIAAGQLGDTARAVSIFIEVSQRYPESAYRVDADLKRARILMKRAAYGDVQSLLEQLKTDFEDRASVLIPAQLVYAQSYQAAGNWERARAEYSYLVTSFPQSLQAVEAALTVARHHADRDETTQASEWYNRADGLAADLARSGSSPPAVVGQAMQMRVAAAVEQKQWDDAALRLGEVVNTFSPRTPAGALALVRLGQLQLRERADTAAALEAWRTFLEFHPEHPQSATLRAEIDKWPKTYNPDSSD